MYQLVFTLIYNMTHSLFFFFPKSGFLWILWIAVGGDSATGLTLVGDCNRFVKVGACSNLIDIFESVLI